MKLLSVWLRLVSFFSAHARFLRMTLAVGFCLAAFCIVLHAQDANAIMQPPSNSAGAQQVANEAISWVFLVLRCCSVIMLGFAAYEMRKGQYAVAVPALIAAIAMMFPPAVIKLATYLSGLFNNSTN